MELYKKYRPKKFENVVGQGEAVEMLRKKQEAGSIPHTVLISGPSGVGKTTIARIIKSAVGCSDVDLTLLNCSDMRGIDTIRAVRSTSVLAPMGGKARLYIIDECHKLTNDAQNAALGLLEDTPKQTWFVLCTTEPEKLIKPLLSRCMQVKLKPITDADLKKLVKYVVGKEEIKASDDVIDKIVEVAEGSARVALVLLDKIQEVEDEEEQLRLIQLGDFKHQAIELAKALIEAKPSWPKVAGLLKALKDEDVESLRYMIILYANAILLNQKGGFMAERCFLIIDIFKEPFYNSKAAGLSHACYDLCKQCGSK